MSAKYDPGRPNQYFQKHRFFGVKLGRNIEPVKQARPQGYVGSDARAHYGIPVELLTAEYLWSTFQAEAEELIRVNGSLDGHEQERNKRINAAYAKLWLADSRFQWAGLAAFASKQVGCGLLHASDTIAKNRRERELAQLSIASAFPGAEAAVGLQAGTEAGATYMHKQLGFGNKHLFLDIYPLHRFYMERGWHEFSDCLSKRQNKRYAVHWGIDQTTLPFGMPFREIRDGFARIETGDVATGVQLLARHEQVNILQAIMYNDGYMQKLLDLNQYAVVTGIPTGDAEKIELTLSAQCKAKEGFTSIFSTDKHAKLWVAEERMKFVLRAADQFHKLLNGPERPQVEASLRAIAHGGGVK